MFNEENTVEQMIFDTLCDVVNYNKVAKELPSYRSGNNDQEYRDGYLDVFGDKSEI